MQKKPALFWVGSVILVSALALAFIFTRSQTVTAAPNAPAIFASPIQAGCYIAASNDCRIHVDPFLVDIAPGQKLVDIKLVTYQMPSGPIVPIYDFRTDQNNPPPFSGSTYSPSQVAQDFAASCGKSYQLILEGRDSGDGSDYSLGSTTAFTCPATVP